MKCQNCGASEADRAMCFRGEPHCCENCRKALAKKPKKVTSNRRRAKTTSSNIRTQS